MEVTAGLLGVLGIIVGGLLTGAAELLLRRRQEGQQAVVGAMTLDAALSNAREVHALAKAQKGWWPEVDRPRTEEWSHYRDSLPVRLDSAEVLAVGEGFAQVERLNGWADTQREAHRRSRESAEAAAMAAAQEFDERHKDAVKPKEGETLDEAVARERREWIAAATEGLEPQKALGARELSALDVGIQKVDAGLRSLGDWSERDRRARAKRRRAATAAARGDRRSSVREHCARSARAHRVEIACEQRIHRQGARRGATGRIVERVRPR
jgi:hypothetical protein